MGIKSWWEETEVAASDIWLEDVDWTELGHNTVHKRKIKNVGINLAIHKWLEVSLLVKEMLVSQEGTSFIKFIYDDGRKLFTLKYTSAVTQKLGICEIIRGERHS
jgi:hypothetical protein